MGFFFFDVNKVSEISDIIFRYLLLIILRCDLDSVEINIVYFMIWFYRNKIYKECFFLKK